MDTIRGITVKNTTVLAVLVLAAPLLARGVAARAQEASFPRDLQVGATGDDVRALQKFLSDSGHLSAAPTGYFGALTKKAVASWQKSAGISPAAGYVGPKSRARLALLLSFVSSRPVAPPPVSAPVSGVAVRLSPRNPASGVLVSSATGAAARVPVVAVEVTNNTADVIVISELKFHKTGIFSDASLAAAYVVLDGKAVGVYQSIKKGVIHFTGLNVRLEKDEIETLQLAIDPARGLPAGNSAAFAVVSSDDIVAAGLSGTPIAVSGSFPLKGNTFITTSVSNPSLAEASIASTLVPATVPVDTLDNVVGSWEFSVSTGKVFLKGIRFVELGTADEEVISNLKLRVNGVQAGATVAALEEDRSVHFNFLEAPATLHAGSNIVQLNADIACCSPGDAMRFALVNPYDVDIVDATYNVPIAGQANEGGEVTIQDGTVTVSVP
jgi:peptidoglycan hydrolase-like protein with peptidoglycan-binding domain